MGRSLSGHRLRANKIVEWNRGVKDQTWPLNLHASIRDVYPLKKTLPSDPKGPKPCNSAMLPALERCECTDTDEVTACPCVRHQTLLWEYLLAIIVLLHSDSDWVFYLLHPAQMKPLAGKRFLIITICTSYSWKPANVFHVRVFLSALSFCMNILTNSRPRNSSWIYRDLSFMKRKQNLLINL